jgi:hypothetical protein
MPPPPPSFNPPPGYVPYGSSSVQGGFRRIGGLTKWLVVLLIATAVAQVITILVQWGLRSAAADYLANPEVVDFKGKLGTYVATAALAGLLAVAQLVLLVIWTFRMAKNLQVLGRVPQAFAPGVTIAINILGSCTLGVLPYFMWREIWRGSDPTTLPNDPTWKQKAYGTILNIHLGLVLAGAMVGFAVGSASGVSNFKSGSTADLAKNLHDKFGVVAAAGLIQVAAVLVFVAVARQLAARHMQSTLEA